MASYQDIETRLRVVEDKLDFIMNLPFVTKKYPSKLMPGQMVVEQRSLLDLYREVKTQNLELVVKAEPDPENENGTV